MSAFYELPFCEPENMLKVQKYMKPHKVNFADLTLSETSQNKLKKIDCKRNFNASRLIYLIIKIEKMTSKKIFPKKIDLNDNDSEFYVKEKILQREEKKQFRQWTTEENQAYALYLEEHLDDFGAQAHRRSNNFFKNMAEFIGNGRINEQCRSHHQKMMKRFKTVENVIRNFKSSQNPHSRALTAKESLEKFAFARNQFLPSLNQMEIQKKCQPQQIQQNFSWALEKDQTPIPILMFSSMLENEECNFLLPI